MISLLVIFLVLSVLGERAIRRDLQRAVIRRRFLSLTKAFVDMEKKMQDFGVAAAQAAKAFQILAQKTRL